MRLRNKPSAFIVGGLLAMAVPILAAQQNSQSSSQASQGSQAASQPSHSAASANERAANLINTINMGEVNTAKMIQGKTQNSQVKDFAQMIQNDHQDSQSKLQSIADQASINLQTDASVQKQNQKQDQSLQKESATAADKAYVRDEARDHRTAIRELQRLEPNVSNAQLKEFVQAQIPVLQKHLTAAEKLETQLGVSATPGATPSHKAGEKGSGGGSSNY